jgi:histidinol dehydrogenase
MIRMIVNPAESKWKELCARPETENTQLEDTVSIIFNEVKSMGDRAVKKNIKRYEGIEIEELFVSAEEVKNASSKLNRQLKNAIDVAYNNIEKFHASQKERLKQVEVIPGVSCWRESKAIEKVGLYIPGGTAPLFSTVLMLGIPAKIAGCKEVILTTPADKEKNIHPAILYSAELCGIKKIVKAGGIQAIAALTYGTESIPAVSKIFGPGNQYVTAAKQYAQRKGVAIDLPAGPSEVLVLADDSADAEFIAADLLAQAEHGTDSQCVLVTFNEKMVNQVNAAIKQQLQILERREIIEKSLKNSFAVVFQNKEQAIAFVNEYAPEHLIIMVNDEGDYLEEIVNAGSVFLGIYTPESAGDYASGTNHTLPTNGFAKAYSGVSLDSFVKKITYQRISPKGLQSLGQTIETMAAAENLTAHKNAVSIRLNKINRN